MLASAARPSLRGDFDAQRWRAQDSSATLTHKASSREAGLARAGGSFVSPGTADCYPSGDSKPGMHVFVCRFHLSHTVIRQI